MHKRILCQIELSDFTIRFLPSLRRRSVTILTMFKKFERIGDIYVSNTNSKSTETWGMKTICLYNPPFILYSPSANYITRPINFYMSSNEHSIS